MEWRNTKNLFVISVAFLFLFSAFGGLTTLQSTVNCNDGLGTKSQMTIYAALVFSALFISPGVTQKIGLKKTFCVSMIGYMFYVIANFKPTWTALILSAVVLGLAAAPLWLWVKYM